MAPLTTDDEGCNHHNPDGNGEEYGLVLSRAAGVVNGIDKLEGLGLYVIPGDRHSASSKRLALRYPPR